VQLALYHQEVKPESWIRALYLSARVAHKEVNLKEERRGRKKEGKGKRKENVNASVNYHKEVSYESGHRHPGCLIFDHHVRSNATPLSRLLQALVQRSRVRMYSFSISMRCFL